MLCRYVNVSDQWILPSPQPYNDQVMFRNYWMPGLLS